MYKFLRSKKGFTLVELMVVVVLLSFGILALANLFRLGYNAFEKSMERYAKQEAAKAVAVYLQNGSSALGGASKVELYDTLDVLPAEDTIEKGCAYIYVDPETGYLYCRDKGTAKATQLSDEPLYITFSIIDTGVKDEISLLELSRGITCDIAVLDEDYFDKLKDPDAEDKNGDGKINFYDVEVTSDDKYYELDVAYHFPNMIENDVLYVNRIRELELDGTLAKTKFIQAFSTVSVSGSESKKTVTTVDEDAILVKFVSDMSIEGEELLTENNMSLYCFIATASYGVGNGEGVVGLLCDFRDNVLLTNPLGEAFVKAYYKLSPPVADIIAESEPLKAAVRVALKPLIVIAVNALDEDVARQSAPWFVAFMLCGAGTTAILIKADKRRKADKARSAKH